MNRAPLRPEIRAWYTVIQKISKNLFSIDPRALAVMRICMALLVLVDLAQRAPLIPVFHSEDGVYPTHLAAEAAPLAISVHLLGGSMWFQTSLFLLAASAALCLLIGWRTRTMTVLSWFLLTSLHHRNYHLLDFGDDALRLLLFWSIFLPLGCRYSLDARRKPAVAPGRPAYSIGAAALLLQSAFVFFFAGVSKMRGESWLNGTAILTILRDDTWVRPLGEFLRQFPDLLSWLTYGTMILEVLAPLCLFMPLATHRFRLGSIGALFVFLLGIGFSIQLGSIPLVMSVALIPFLPAWVWNRFEAWVSAKPGSNQQAGELSHRGGPTHERKHVRVSKDVFIGMILLYVIVANIDAVLSRRILPQSIHDVAYSLRMDQGWSMYAPDPGEGNSRIIIRGTLPDGRRIQLAPGARREGWKKLEPWDPLEVFWSDYRARMYLHDYIAFNRMKRELHAFVRWVRHRWSAEHPGQVLEDIEVIKQISTPSEAAIRRIKHTQLLLSGRCTPRIIP